MATAACEQGPDSGYPPPQIGDFAQNVVDRDLNIAIAQFISATGIALALSERRVDLPVLVVPNGDYPLPPDLVSLTQIEYTPAGQQVYRLIGLEFGAWNDRFGNVQNPDTGQPYFYRRPYAGYVRLQPIPSLGNVVGVGIGAITFMGTPTPGQIITVTLSNNVTTVTTLPYTVSPTDTIATTAVQVATAINASAAVTGAGAFLQPPSPVSNVVNLSSVNPPGTGIWYEVAVSGMGSLSATPTSQTYLNPSGDVISFYYTSIGPRDGVPRRYAGHPVAVPHGDGLSRAGGLLEDQARHSAVQGVRARVYPRWSRRPSPLRLR